MNGPDPHHQEPRPSVEQYEEVLRRIVQAHAASLGIPEHLLQEPTISVDDLPPVD